ncbi:MAG TPA: carboxypeptidase regulatory-like domain-containing protein [Verrucomicrobiae bacterium]|nr:carboxypeptidase regulatory-like domain-containing protein [Verrucomicrobiae bacterium]
MKILIAMLCLQFCSAAFAGTIVGTVRAEPKSGVEKETSGGEYSQLKYRHLETVDYSAMHDFVVYIDDLNVTNLPATNVMEVATMKVAQKSAIFSPHVLPIVAGTTVEWPNYDDIYHNVFSMSDAKSFDLGLYKGNPTNKWVTFNHVGRVDVFCSIHANMHCIVLVLPNPYFASTDASGHYAITNVPPGKYKLKAWHERLPADTKKIVVPTNGDVRADFTLTIKNLPKY